MTTPEFGELLASQAKGKEISVTYTLLNAVIRHLNLQANPNITPLNYSAEELIFRLLTYLTSEKYLIIIFNEVDFFVQNSKDSGVQSHPPM